MVALWCALASVGTCLVAALATMEPSGFKPSALVHIGSGDPLAPLAQAAAPGFAFSGGNHYDGEYYYAIARDPLARGEEHRLIDRAAYRYGHPALGFLGALASLGSAPLVPVALLLAVLACAGLAGWAGARLAEDLGRSPWLGLSIALNPGIVLAASVVTSEAIGLAAILLALWAWRRGKLGVALGALAVGCFAKESYVLVPVGIAVFELVRRREGVARRVGLLALTPLPFVCWYAYVWARFGTFPQSQARDLTSAPFVGWLDTLHKAAAQHTAGFEAAQLGMAAIPLIVVAGIALLVGALRSLALATEVHPVFLLLAVTAFTLNWWNLLYPKDLLRALAVALALLPFTFERRALA
jgi:hypothetical protein